MRRRSICCGSIRRREGGLSRSLSLNPCGLPAGPIGFLAPRAKLLALRNREFATSHQFYPEKSALAAALPSPILRYSLQNSLPAANRPSLRNSCPVSALHPGYRPGLRPRKAARMRCGVAGSSSIDTANGARASLMALRMAAGAPIAPPSPRPFALVIVNVSDSVSR
jgi:hypothetical protein